MKGEIKMNDAFEDAWDVSKFDSNRAEIARQMQQAEQPPYVGDDEDLNLNIGVIKANVVKPSVKECKEYSQVRLMIMLWVIHINIGMK